eukprot:CAMPEP_0175811254 /NCGR_PEP_ID=MMETSP0107_2-20121207/3752_1 /TAXON_ID=195067 ORGANISM="Goniomonas pacifica, Strain CCMP1869" /NCGR_SAMPLE_ID=MMETSP0107_2 /ASSEMBLY_ACC=CAM_ASM_000203 /LENGTH=57 /DNA_ID=CAMNT_0017123051 /DNA_START=22 /DNA_END=195 /DNA_ORIENTATION=+
MEDGDPAHRPEDPISPHDKSNLARRDTFHMKGEEDPGNLRKGLLAKKQMPPRAAASE